MSQLTLKELLLKGLSQLELAQTPDEEQQEKLVQYVKLLDKWNKTYNLTAVRDPAQMVTRHLLDSLTVCPFLKGTTILDVGTGAGLPGIVLAVVFPEKQFTLLDSNNKKTRFVIQAAAELELTNVDVVQSRVEKYQPAELFDTVITRAYSAIGDMLQQTTHLLSDKGIFLAMKGANPVAEMGAVSANYVVRENHTIRVPGLDEERHLLEIVAKNKN